MAIGGIMLNDQVKNLQIVRKKLETLSDIPKPASSIIDEVVQDLSQLELEIQKLRNVVNNQSSSDHSSATTESASLNEVTTPAAGKPKRFNDKEYIEGNMVSPEMLGPSRKQHHTFSEKEYVTRESYLTTLLENDHIKTIYHIFYTVFLLFALNNIVYDYFVKGSIGFGLATFQIGFAKIHYVLRIWLVQHIFVCTLYYALKIWAYFRCKLMKQKYLRFLWSLYWLTMYIISQLIFLYVPANVCLKLDLPYVSALVLLLETIRMLMKMHSFVRTISARCLKGKLKCDKDMESKAAVHLPSFEKYVYYLFAPTLLYRDDYPRTSVIRWKFATARFLEVVAVAFLYSYIYERHIKLHFGHIGLEEFSASSLTVNLFGMIMPCLIIFLSGFYVILHSWLNFTAELLRFGDRMFYRDWWTAYNYDAYYRNWNVVVHDWLHEYVYKDLYIYVFRGSRFASSLAVFTISALFHEYVLGYALQVFFPVMFVFFGIVGVLMIFITRLVPKNVGNIMVWFTLIFGYGMMMCLYSMEYFASKNCPKMSYESWSDVLMPHLWSCYRK